MNLNSLSKETLIGIIQDLEKAAEETQEEIACLDLAANSTKAPTYIELEECIEELLDTPGIRFTSPNGLDGYECPWCGNDNERHSRDCIIGRARELLNRIP